MSIQSEIDRIESEVGVQVDYLSQILVELANKSYAQIMSLINVRFINQNGEVITGVEGTAIYISNSNYVNENFSNLDRFILSNSILIIICNEQNNIQNVEVSGAASVITYNTTETIIYINSSGDNGTVNIYV